MTEKLNRKLELWGMIDQENSLGEKERTEDKIKDVWANVIPKHGRASTYGNTNVSEVTQSLVIKCRKKSINEPSIDMFFKNGNQKYKVIDFIPDFKTNSFWEFNCEVIYE